jgi:hypothetical protein
VQGLAFNDGATMRFGLVQARGGPCALLATLNAFVVARLAAAAGGADPAASVLDAAAGARDDALVGAMAEIVWRAAAAPRMQPAKEMPRARIVLCARCAMRATRG